MIEMLPGDIVMSRRKNTRNTLISGLFFVSFFAFSQPAMPRLDKAEYQSLAEKSGTQFAVADECGMSNEIQKKMKSLDEFLSANYGYSGLDGYFNSARGSRHANFNILDKVKQCYISSGKVKSGILRVEREIDGYYKKIKINYDGYEKELMAWRENERKKKEERRVRIQSEARELADFYGKWVVRSYYDGGKKIQVNLIEHDLQDSSQNEIRLKVNMTWSGSISDESGYGADGIISVTTVDGKWSGKDWSPSWESSKLKDYKEMKQIGNVFRSLLGQ
ncbi:hypothetical protein LVC68_08550 [Melaminivora jejuensis]|uniref:hypothetical protein n=2 Tax=Melaminivora jejuensis TaxID=1267217 RepID=UPI001E60BBA2|nr:hypothetical protein [Melaminivora jejuensis]UHJ63498.1 hypothetical protein LVC68_08550 [Melaminivora jejuensis]